MSDIVDYLWGVSMNLNGSIKIDKDIIGDSSLNKVTKNYDEILSNISILKEKTDIYLQNLINANPNLISKEKKVKEDDDNIDN